MRGEPPADRPAPPRHAPQCPCHPKRQVCPQRDASRDEFHRSPWARHPVLSSPITPVQTPLARSRDLGPGPPPRAPATAPWRPRCRTGVERDNRGVDELEQLSGRRPACYVATPCRCSTIFLRCLGVAIFGATARFLARNCSPTRSCALLRSGRTRIRLPAPPQILMILPKPSVNGPG